MNNEVDIRRKKNMEKRRRNMTLAFNAKVVIPENVLVKDGNEHTDTKEPHIVESVKQQQESNDTAGPEIVSIIEAVKMNSEVDNRRKKYMDKRRRNMTLAFNAKVVTPENVLVKDGNEHTDTKEPHIVESVKQQQESNDDAGPDKIPLKSEIMLNNEQGLDAFISDFVGESINKIKMEMAQEAERKARLRLKLFQDLQYTWLYSGYKADILTFTKYMNEVDHNLRNMPTVEEKRNRNDGHQGQKAKRIDFRTVWCRVSCFGHHVGRG